MGAKAGVLAIQPARSQVKVSPVDQRMDSILFGNVRTSSILGGFMDLLPSNRLTNRLIVGMFSL
jgi:hypothetical protein